MHTAHYGFIVIFRSRSRKLAMTVLRYCSSMPCLESTPRKVRVSHIIESEHIVDALGSISKSSGLECIVRLLTVCSDRNGMELLLALSSPAAHLSLISHQYRGNRLQSVCIEGSEPTCPIHCAKIRKGDHMVTLACMSTLFARDRFLSETVQ